MNSSTKLDLYKVHKDEYVTPKTPALIRVKPAKYLAIAGRGKPGGDTFHACVGALYAMVYTIKMTRKFAGKRDYAVCKLEAQWFFDRDPKTIPQEQWQWKLLVRTPDFIRQADLDKAAAALLENGKSPDVKTVKLERIDEGRCVQMLHVGPYDRVSETIAVMCEFLEAQGLKLAGPHHEIYLSDPRRVPAARLKTIVREPVAKA